MRALMIDLEAMGRMPDGAILSIGAVGFDRSTGLPLEGAEFLHNVSLSSAMKAGLTVNPQTIEWWMAQPEEARKALLDPAPVSLGAALEALTWFWFTGRFSEMWSHQFDSVLLLSAYEKLGRKVPWSYRQVRDLRTWESIYGRLPKVPQEGVPHSALDDARHQVKQMSLQIQELTP
jgi:exodeoxyribonuclease VIII